MDNLFDFIDRHPLKALASLVGLIIAFAMLADAASCHAKWSGSGYDTRWGPVQGCQVKVADNKWLPSAALRDINL